MFVTAEVKKKKVLMETTHVFLNDFIFQIFYKDNDTRDVTQG